MCACVCEFFFLIMLVFILFIHLLLLFFLSLVIMREGELMRCRKSLGEWDSERGERGRGRGGEREVVLLMIEERTLYKSLCNYIPSITPPFYLPFPYLPLLSPPLTSSSPFTPSHSLHNSSFLPPLPLPSSLFSSPYFLFPFHLLPPFTWSCGEVIACCRSKEMQLVCR